MDMEVQPLIFEIMVLAGEIRSVYLVTLLQGLMDYLKTNNASRLCEFTPLLMNRLISLYTSICIFDLKIY